MGVRASVEWIGGGLGRFGSVAGSEGRESLDMKSRTRLVQLSATMSATERPYERPYRVVSHMAASYGHID